MSKYFISIGFIFLLIFLPLLNVEGRGARGGGRGRAGQAGAARSARAGVGSSIQRSPSLSRSAPRSTQLSQVRQTAQMQQTRATNLNTQRQALRNQLSAQQGVRTASNNSALAQQFRTTRVQQQQLNVQNANLIRNQINQRHPGYQNWFNNNFFDRHGFRPNYYNPGVNWWRAARWSTVNNWLGAGWAVPVYYDTVQNVYYEDPDYSSNIPMSSGQVAYDQGSYYSPSLNQTETSWLPLGVFALSQSPEQTSQANMFFQLALNRNGEISGIYFNSSINGIFEMVGTVDKSTQQVIMQISNYSYPIFITALDNLTDYQTPIRLQFANSIEQTWTLTQLQQ